VTGPAEPAGGQDDPPDLGAALRAAVRLLDDVGAQVTEGPHTDLRLRAGAVRRALARLLEERRP
jgi:hypothetical protein